MQMLKKKDFKSIQVGKIKFIKQINLFRNAKIITGPHGAAFTNLLFCKPETEIIEIKPKNRPNNYRVISKVNNLKYKQFISITIPKNRSYRDMYIDPKKYFMDLKMENDISLYIPVFNGEKTIESCLESVPIKL